MKTIFVLFIIIFSSTCFAYQCPEINDFYQDSNNIWHLNKTPPAPPGAAWTVLHQGPLAPSYHELNYIDVGLYAGTWPYRVSCDYGKDDNVFMGVELHVSEKQKPKPLKGSNFDDDAPPCDCTVSAVGCQFDIVG